MVDRPVRDPTRSLARSKENHRPVIFQVVASTPPGLVPNEGTLEVEPNVTVGDSSLVETKEKPEAEEPIRALPSDDSSPIEATVQDQTGMTPEETPMEPEPPEIEPPGPPQEEPVCYHEGGELFAEDVKSHMAVLPEVATTAEEVTIEDIQVGNPAENTTEEIERLRRIS
ncbi:hypothetical protein PF001_g11243 [Phytophthora fragariae]|nr:hypothetical protein PF009_g24401 [Phytophthora fragariae]KAE9308268.1 hypothetical protein PF001_g11243 [Phytophthora fragariae]